MADRAFFRLDLPPDLRRGQPVREVPSGLRMFG